MDELVSKERRVAITGARTFLGTELIRRLEEDARYEKILALDIRQPDLPFEKTEFHNLDLTVPAVGAQLADLLRDAEIDTFVHAAFLSHPTHAGSWAHELEDVGTMHVLNACAEVEPDRIIMASSTLVYGASPGNPNFLSEETELRPHTRSRFLRDKIRAEKQVSRFAEEHPDVAVTILRFAPLLGPTVTNFFTRFFSRPVSPVMMGYDPLLQFVHERDAVDALKTVLDQTEVEGIYNIVGEGVLPYTTVLALMGKVPVPMPHFVARGLSKALWATQVTDAPPSFLDFLRFLCVADGEKARRELGFRPRHNLKRTILDFLGVAADEDAPDIARVYG